MIVAGNPSYGLAKSIKQIFPNAIFYSRSSNNCDLTTDSGRKDFSSNCIDHDVIIICSALWRFNQTLLLDSVYKQCTEHKKQPLIICIGSTVDRSKNGKTWLYGAEKKALRDYCNTLSMCGVWSGGPRVTLISFGTLDNVQSKHPNRICMSMDHAVSYIKWIVEQPSSLHINEISIDPIQSIKT
jgi:hypothetical protein